MEALSYRYATKQLTSDRENFLDMGRRAAKLTLPYLLTDEGRQMVAAPDPLAKCRGQRACNVLGFQADAVALPNQYHILQTADQRWRAGFYARRNARGSL